MAGEGEGEGGSWPSVCESWSASELTSRGALPPPRAYGTPET